MIVTKDWGRNQINLSHLSDILQLKPVELHHRANGSVSEKPTFCMVLASPVSTVPLNVIGQVSLEMLNNALNDLGYKIVPYRKGAH